MLMLPLIGSIIGAGASLLGGMMNNSSQESINRQNAASAAEANQKNYEAQKEFAQQGLRWKVEDAKAAGIHPVYAIGAPTQSFAPSFVGSTSLSGNPGDGLTAAGQEIGRAVATTQTGAERAYNQTLQALQLDRAGLENELLRTQIRRQMYETGPAFATAGGMTGVVPPGADLMLGGNRLKVSDKTSPAEAWQNQYGDIMENVVGVPMAVGDLFKHWTRGVMPWVEATPGRAKIVQETRERTRNLSPFPYDVFHNSPSGR